MPSLHIYRDQTLIFRHHLTGTARIGRSVDCHIALAAQSVSRTHCEVASLNSTWHVRDLGSRHGTFLNGEPVQDAPLADGDRITVGEITAVFHRKTFRPETTRISALSAASPASVGVPNASH